MKIYLCADIEGITGFTSKEDAHPPSLFYPPLAIQMSQEVSAVCKGFLEAGASSILVEDCHGDGRNIIASYLPESTSLISGLTHDIFGVTGNFSKDFDALAFVGYHDGAYSDGNPSSHTMSGRTVRKLIINDIPMTEFHLHAYAAAKIKVPVIFLSGDMAICKKAEQLIPEITTFATLIGSGNASVYSSPAFNLQKLQEAACKSLKRKELKQNLSLPASFHVTLEYIDHYRAKQMSHYPGAKKLDAFTISFESDDYQDIMRFFTFAL
jgi:D-amino peptidase